MVRFVEKKPLLSIWIVSIHRLKLKFWMWKNHVFTQQLDILSSSEQHGAAPVKKTISKFCNIFISDFNTVIFFFSIVIVVVLIKKRTQYISNEMKKTDITIAINFSKTFKTQFLLTYNISIHCVFFVKIASQICGVYCSVTHVTPNLWNIHKCLFWWKFQNNQTILISIFER